MACTNKMAKAVQTRGSSDLVKMQSFFFLVVEAADFLKQGFVEFNARFFPQLSFGRVQSGFVRFPHPFGEVPMSGPGYVAEKYLIFVVEDEGAAGNGDFYL